MKKNPILLSTLVSVFLVAGGFSQSKEVVSAVSREVAIQGETADFSRPIFPKKSFFVAHFDIKKTISTPMGKFLGIDDAERFYTAFDKVASERDLGIDPGIVQYVKNQKKFRDYVNQHIEWAAAYVTEVDFSQQNLEEAFDIVPHAAIVASLNEDTTIDLIMEQITNNTSNLPGCIYGGSLCVDLGKDATISSETIAGCDVRKITLKKVDEKHFQELEPCVCVYQDRIVIVATSPVAFAEVMDLYSQKTASLPEDSPILKDIQNQVNMVGFYGFDQFANKTIEAISDNEKDEKFLRNQFEMAVNLQSMTFSYLLDQNAMVYTPTINATFVDSMMATNVYNKANDLIPMLGFGAMFFITKVPSAAILSEIIPALKIFLKDCSVIVEMPIQKKSIEKIDYEKFLKEYIQFKQETEELRADDHCDYDCCESDESVDVDEESDEEE